MDVCNHKFTHFSSRLIGLSIYVYVVCDLIFTELWIFHMAVIPISKSVINK
jgi:hypothetical protein